jgi:hypothetical protein
MVESYAQKYNNIFYFGEYNFFQDIATIYAKLDMLYMSYDTTSGIFNNEVALPNKLYEAMYFRVPIITSSNTYLGNIVQELGIGIAVSCCNKKDLFEQIVNFDIKKVNENFLKLKEKQYLGDEDYRNLGDYICTR